MHVALLGSLGIQREVPCMDEEPNRGLPLAMPMPCVCVPPARPLTRVFHPGVPTQPRKEGT